MEKNERNVISIVKLREAIDLILERVEGDFGCKQLVLDEDLYWSVHAEQLYDANLDRVDCSLGSLYDDWEFVARVLEEPQRAVPRMLIHVAPLLAHLSRAVRISTSDPGDSESR